jgi:hypothetical protein
LLPNSALVEYGSKMSSGCKSGLLTCPFRGSGFGLTLSVMWPGYSSASAGDQVALVGDRAAPEDGIIELFDSRLAAVAENLPDPPPALTRHGAAVWTGGG